jgi:hypothetical protein
MSSVNCFERISHLFTIYMFLRSVAINLNKMNPKSVSVLKFHLISKAK